MKIIYICIGESLTGKTILASLLNRDVYVFDNYSPDFFENNELVEKINNVKDRDAIFFIVCNEYPIDLILTLDLDLNDNCKVIICENKVAIDKEKSE
jgi:hypothetical protein